MIEAMVVVGIVGIMLGIGIPSMAPAITKVRMDAEIDELQRGLNFAQEAAIQSGQTVTVCPGNAATTACSVGQNWSNGWVVMSPAQTKPLLVMQPLRSGDTLNSTSIATNAYPKFTSTGYPFFYDKLTLHDAANTPSLYQCVVFNAGTWTAVSGSACP